MIKILQVTAAYIPAYVYGGPTISVGNLCNALIQKEVALTVITTTANGKEDFEYSNNTIIYREGVKVVYFRRLFKDHVQFSPGLLFYLWQHIRDFDIVHIHAWWNLTSIGSCIICVLNNKKFIVSPRGTLSQYSFYNRTSYPKRIFHRLIGKFILKKAFFLVSSAKEKRDLEALQLNKGKEIAIIPNVVQLPLSQHFKKQITVTNSQPIRLLFFSRIEEKKRLNILIQALAGINIPFILNIYGSGKEAYVQQLKQLVATLHLNESIHFCGAVYGDAKFGILASHDVLVLPSYDENFANVVLESLYVGTALLVTASVGLSDYIADHNFGWICRLDTEHIGKQIEQISQSRDDLERISKTAPAAVKKDFDEKQLAGMHYQFYSKIVFQ